LIRDRVPKAVKSGAPKISSIPVKRFTGGIESAGAYRRRSGKTPLRGKARTMELAMEQPYQGPVRQVISAWMALTMVAIAAFIVSVI
jgi:hypothetical protein